MKKNLNIVLVHGAFGDGSHWKYVIPALAKEGYNVKAVQLPLATLTEDIKRTSDLVDWLEGPTLLVGHSYGGVVITGAGNNPNVVGLVYIAAFAPTSGESAGELLKLRAQPEGIAAVIPDPQGYLYVGFDKYHEVFSPGVSEEDATVMSLSQKPIHAIAFNGVSGAAAWETKPSWYQISELDKMIQPETQAWFAERMKAKKIIKLSTGHASLASSPREVVELILEAAASFE
jgi:pimeloyl-ACP methyl ester carboxylesterase